MQLIFRRPNGGRLELLEGAVVAVDRYRQVDTHAPEAGGVLLGRHILQSQDIVVDAVTEPASTDRGTRVSFFRSRRPHQAQIRTAWEESGGTCHYLGEWHTHPQAVPTPSLIDLLDWRRHLLLDRYMGPSLFFVIVGTDAIRAWEGRRRSPRFLPLAPVADSHQRAEAHSATENPT